MGCGLISQRAPTVEVHHPLSNDPAARAAGAHIVRVPAPAEPPAASASNRPGLGDTRVSHDSQSSASGPVPEAQARPQGRPISRRFLMGERILLTSRLPSNLQDHAFCFECGAFFHMDSTRAPQCIRCNVNFVQYLRTVGGENWISANSSTGMNFSFDDQLDNSVTASLDETPAPKTPTQGAFLRGLPTLQLAQADSDERAALDSADPRKQCSICRESFRSGEVLKQLPCVHEFRESCIIPWLHLNNTCPICRWKMPQGLDEENDADDVETPQVPASQGHSSGFCSSQAIRQNPHGQESGT